MKIVVTGNPIDGFDFIGPFPEDEDIDIDALNLKGEWWIVTLTDPQADLVVES